MDKIQILLIDETLHLPLLKFLLINVEEVDFKSLGIILGFREFGTIVLEPEYPGVVELSLPVPTLTMLLV